MNSTNTKLDPQAQLAASLEAMHLDINKLCMEHWSLLAKGEFDPRKIDKIQEGLRRIVEEIDAARNYCMGVMLTETNSKGLLQGTWVNDQPDQSEIN